MSIPQLDKKGFETSFISGKATVVVNKNILVFGIYLMGCTNQMFFFGDGNKLVDYEYIACLSINS